MKRYIALMCAILIVSLTACAPNNIISPQENTDNTVQTNTEPESTEQPTKEQPEIQTEQPETEIETGIVTDVKIAENEVPNASTAKTAKNEAVRPTLDVDALDYVRVKTADLTGKTVELYTSADSAFSAGDLNESQWFAALKDEYGLDVKYTLRSSGTLYASQAIAQRSGVTLDVITADISNSAASLSLIKSMSDRFVTQNEQEQTDNIAAAAKTVSNPFSKTVFDKTNGKLFSAVGNGKMLWYNVDLLESNTPYTLFKNDKWTADALAVCAVTSDEKKASIIECNNWIAFASAASQATGLTDSGYTLSIINEYSINSFKSFADIFTAERRIENTSFAKGTVVFKYTSIPDKQSFKLGYAPIPKASDVGQYAVELCGRAMGVSKTVREENIGTAFTFIQLWCARYSESIEDKVTYDLGLDAGKAADYIAAVEQYGQLYNVDADIASVFNGITIPEKLYSDADTVYNQYYKAYNRADLINERYLSNIE